MLKLAESHLLLIPPYIAGRAIDKSLLGTKWAKLGSNENCLGPSSLALEAIGHNLKSCNWYPIAKRAELINAICEYAKIYEIKPHHVALGNGTSELILDLVRGLVSSDEAVLYGWPSFVMYGLAARIRGCGDVAIRSLGDLSFDLEAMLKRVYNAQQMPVKLIFLSNPNNPTGNYISKNIIEDFLDNIPKDIICVIDEAYFEYVANTDYDTSISYVLKRPRTLVLRTFSKAYGLAGLRIGYALGDEEIIDILDRIRDPFNTNLAGQCAAIAALEDHEHVRRSKEHNSISLPKLARVAQEAGFKTFPSVGNFILAERAPSMPKIPELCQKLYDKGVVVRALKEFGLENHVRISVGTLEEIAQLAQVLKVIL